MRRHRRKSQAEASPGLLTPGGTIEYPDAELGRFRHPPFSMWSGMKYVLVLSVLLWWLPTFGQMIAGYIGGRRAGGPWRGIAAAIVPVAIIVVLAGGAEQGLLGPWLEGLVAIPGAIGTFVSLAVPPAAPYVDFVLGYLAAFVEALRATLAMGANGYLVTVVFAYIGGILAEQARREVTVGRGAAVGISITQPLLAPFRAPHPAWEGDQPVQFEEMRKIPVSAAHARERRPPKVHARRADARVADAKKRAPERPAREAKGKPERKDRSSYDREIATRRFVERALRQYEAAHRR